MPAPTLDLQPQQRQAATPRLQQSVRLLQLSAFEFAQELASLAARNPFLDVEEGEAAVDEDRCGAVDAWLQSSTSDRATAGARDSDQTALDFEPTRPGLRDSLTSQLGMTRLSARAHALARAVIESLDDDGYLRISLAELAAVTRLTPEPDISEMNTALANVQALDPPGVGARDLSECLLLQLEQLDDADAHSVALARDLARDHLPALAARTVDALARELGRTHDQIAAASRLIRRLDPRPGARCADHRVLHVTPDVIVQKVRGSWRAKLNPAIAPRARVNTVYADLFERHREAGHAELANHLREAQWLVRNVEQRLTTITAVAKAILKRQHGFLEFGALAMRPLRLREIADEVGVHESTVCRVTNNKFMATPAGVFELKYFFSRAMPTDHGAACSATAIRGVISQMIADESPTAPLSDAAITGQLKRHGLPVARRTVTKYRQGLKLPVAEARRRVAGA